ncbi:MAG: 16S rRNA (adenine(1518)-N(6)/adenine(1519)-N(6))-dimethyltransferase RsmA [Firmicutes bacterium]|nr:16S rRNA (adenine(1518)-N(6)/adenine(1519)-N(6))-dimethyltransferase RsmA [Bacillota bacterium]
MEKLSNPTYVTKLLAQHGIRLQKKWGQNFLIDENILRKIVETAELREQDHVLEVGAGIGTLTQKLAAKAGRVTTLEIDERLRPILQKTLAPYENVTVRFEDAVRADYSDLCREGPLKLVANLPYNAATPLLYRWLKEEYACFTSLVCMVQKEVAQRIVAEPGNKNYGTLSVICQYAARVEIVFTVPRTVFLPRPEVESAVVKFSLVKQRELTGHQEQLFFQLVEGAFAKRRKTLLNALSAALNLSKDELMSLGEKAGLDLNRRGETLTVKEFASLARLLYNKSS